MSFWTNPFGEIAEFNKKNSWALPLEIGLGGAAALATGGLALPALFGEAGAAAGAGGLGALFGGAEVGAEAGAGGLAALFGEGAAAGEGAVGGIEAGLGGAEGLAGDILPATAAPASFTGDVSGALGIDNLFASGGSAGAEAAPAEAASSFASGGAEAGGASPGGGNFWDSIVSGAKSSVAKNPLGIAAAGAGLGMNLLKGNQITPEQQRLKDQAAQLGESGKVLQQYLTDGTLPPAMKAALDQATNAAKARIISNHARSGQPTDPSMNSALAQELNSVDMNAVGAMADAQIKMMQTGLQETGLSSQLYQMLVKMDTEANNQLMQAIASFSSALGGGTKTIKVTA